MHKTTFILSLLLFGLVCQAQNVLMVNQNPDFDQSAYSNLADAVAAASAGDFIYIYPGQYNGTTVSIDKQLNLVGVGYLLSLNYPNHGYLEPTTFLAHSVSITEGGQYTKCTGIDFNELIITSENDILITRCLIRKANISNAQNLQIHSCYIGGSFYGQNNWDCQILMAGFNAVAFENCLFNDSYSSGNRNRIFYSSYNGQATGSISMNRCITRNYLFNGYSAMILTVKNSFSLTPYTFITNSTSLGAGSIIYNCLIENSTSKYASSDQNIFSIDPADEFVGYPTIGNYSFDNRYELLPSSNAIGYASDGGDCGIFGGSQPYILSGAPSIPFIYHFDSPHETTTGSGIDVNIKVKSKNE